MFDPESPTRSDADLVALADHLIGTALRRQTWLLLLDDEPCALRTVVAIDDMPVDPDPADLARFADHLRFVAAETGAEAMALVWERPGGPVLRMQEADWVAAMAAADAPIRAQLLSSDAGVRLLDPAFEALVE